MPSTKLMLISVVLLIAVARLPAAVIGTNSPASPLTRERLAVLPTREQPAWRDYLGRSDKQAREDREFFRNEMRRHGMAKPVMPPGGQGTAGIELDRPKLWYASDEAARIAEIIVSFQTPAGGWSKNLDMTKHPRSRGEFFAVGDESRFVNAADQDAPHDPDWNYVGTFDNGATTTQLRFLAKVIAARQSEPDESLHQSFRHGLEYIFASQYPNGGWPQVWPLQGGYHDAVTFNDGAMTATLDLLSDVAVGNADFTFLPSSTRKQAAEGLALGLKCMLAVQVVEKGKRTAWCQQYDALTLLPTSARNYEIASLSSGESAGGIMFLMQLSAPDSNVVAAVRAAAAWFRQTAIRDKEFRRTDEGRRLLDAPSSVLIWSRYYELGSQRPIFGDRDRSIHDTVDEISRERRDGYAWFTDAPKRALKRFEDRDRGRP